MLTALVLVSQMPATIVANDRWSPGVTEPSAVPLQPQAVVESGKSLQQKMQRVADLYRLWQQKQQQEQHLHTELEKVSADRCKFELELSESLSQLKHDPRIPWSPTVRKIGIQRTVADRLVAGYDIYSASPAVVQAAVLEARVSVHHPLIAKVVTELKVRAAAINKGAEEPEFLNYCVERLRSARKDHSREVRLKKLKERGPATKADSFVQQAIKVFCSLPSNAAREQLLKQLLHSLEQVGRFQLVEGSERGLQIKYLHSTLIAPTGLLLSTANACDCGGEVGVEGPKEDFAEER